MRQRDLDRDVARATGESVRTVAEMGFVPLDPAPFDRDPESYALDWDERDAARNVAIMPQQPRPAAVA